MHINEWGGPAIERTQRRINGARVWGYAGVRLVQK